MYCSAHIHYASMRGYRDVIVCLIANKADIHCVNNNKETPLHIACRTSYDNTSVILLSENEASVFIKNVEKCYQY